MVKVAGVGEHVGADLLSAGVNHDKRMGDAKTRIGQVIQVDGCAG